MGAFDAEFGASSPECVLRSRALVFMYICFNSFNDGPDLTFGYLAADASEATEASPAPAPASTTRRADRAADRPEIAGAVTDAARQQRGADRRACATSASTLARSAVRRAGRARSRCSPASGAWRSCSARPSSACLLGSSSGSLRRCRYSRPSNAPAQSRCCRSSTKLHCRCSRRAPCRHGINRHIEVARRREGHKLRALESAWRELLESHRGGHLAAVDDHAHLDGELVLTPLRRARRPLPLARVPIGATSPRA